MYWLKEMITNFKEGNNQFYWRGRRFDILPNRSFIVDDSLKCYGLTINQNQLLN